MDDYKLNDQASPHTAIAPVPVVKRRSLWRQAIWVLVILAVIGGVVWWVEMRPAPAQRTGRFQVNGPMPVVTAIVEKADVGITLNALGTVTPSAVVTVRSQVGGQLVNVAFREGQLVKKGDLLAEIDPRPYQFALAQAQGTLQRDQSLLKNAELDLARYKTLAAQDSIPKQQLDTQAALVAQYQGTVQTDQGLVDNAKLNLSYTKVVAPMDGRVGLRQIDQGNYVQLSDAGGLVVLTAVQPITVIFNVPEDNIPAIMRRVTSGASLPVTAFDRAQLNKLATGKLVTVDNQIDQTTGTVKLRAEFPNEDGVLFPNQFVNIQLLVDTVKDASVIPTPAIQRGAPGTFVYAVKEDGTAHVQPVKLGVTQGEKVQIISGLNVGDPVVVDGADKLRDGAAVSQRDATGAAVGNQPAANQNDTQRGQRGQQRRRGNSP